MSNSEESKKVNVDRRRGVTMHDVITVVLTAVILWVGSSILELTESINKLAVNNATTSTQLEGVVHRLGKVEDKLEQLTR